MNQQIDNMTDATDSQLVAGLKNGDMSSFNEILSRYTERVHNLAMRITRNEEDTEEILQDVFVTVYKKIAKFEGKSAFSSWLYRITANTAFMKLRKRKQNVAISFDDVSEGIRDSWVSDRSEETDVNFISARHELRAELEQAMARLPTEYRAIFVLRDVDGLSNDEVAGLLGLTVPAVKSRLHRSRLMLRKRLHRYYVDYTSDSISYGQAMV